MSKERSEKIDEIFLGDSYPLLYESEGIIRVGMNGDTDVTKLYEEIKKKLMEME